MTNELDELIKKAQEQPGIVEIMDVQRRYNELLRQSGIILGEVAPDTISSYSSDSS
ncbi:MAG: hypothetical protein ABR985_04095 [Methanotrichaceae archaeon]|jgi:hypothetical protein